MKVPTLIFIFLLLLCFASSQEGGGYLNKCGLGLEVANFLNGFDGHYFAQAYLSEKPVYGMKDKCIWCHDYKTFFFVANISLIVHARQGDCQ
jgi:hypothetical protein